MSSKELSTTKHSEDELDLILDKLEATKVQKFTGVGLDGYAITKTEAKKQIKSLFLELMDGCEDWTGDTSDNERRIFNEEAYRKKIKEL